MCDKLTPPVATAASDAVTTPPITWTRPVSTRGIPTRSLRSTALRLAAEPPGWLFSIGGSDRDPTVRRELRLSDPDQLIGLVADESWRGVAVVLPAHTSVDDPDDDRASIDLGDAATVAFVLDRRGRGHVAVGVDGATHSVGSVHSIGTGVGVTGFLADVTARVLGLPTPPEPTDPAELVLRVWLQHLLDAAADPTTPVAPASWPDAVALHPAWRADHGLDPAVHDAAPADVARVTVELGRQLRWERMRTLAADGTIVLPGLAASEAAWMDWPFFARWTLDVHRPSTDVLDDLSLFLDGALLRDVRYTVHAVGWLGFADSHAS